MFDEMTNDDLDKYLSPIDDRHIGVILENGTFCIIIYDECGIEDYLGSFKTIMDAVKTARECAADFNAIFDDDEEIIKAYYYDHN